MEVPASVPQWMINLAVVASFIITAIGGLIYQQREKKTPKPDAAGTVAVLGGSLASERALDRLCEALGHVERSNRDSERATINLTNEVARSRDELGEVRQQLAARNDHFETDAARLLAAIEASRGGKG